MLLKDEKSYNQAGSKDKHILSTSQEAN